MKETQLTIETKCNGPKERFEENVGANEYRGSEPTMPEPLIKSVTWLIWAYRSRNRSADFRISGSRTRTLASGLGRSDCFGFAW